MCVEKAGSILNIFNPFFHKKKEWKDATKYSSNDSALTLPMTAFVMLSETKA